MAHTGRVIAELERVNARMTLDAESWRGSRRRCRVRDCARRRYHLAADGNAVPRFPNRVERIDGSALRPTVGRRNDGRHNEGITKRKEPADYRRCRRFATPWTDRAGEGPERRCGRVTSEFHGVVTPRIRAAKNTTSGRTHMTTSKGAP